MMKNSVVDKHRSFEVFRGGFTNGVLGMISWFIGETENVHASLMRYSCLLQLYTISRLDGVGSGGEGQQLRLFFRTLVAGLNTRSTRMNVKPRAIQSRFSVVILSFDI